MPNSAGDVYSKPEKQSSFAQTCNLLSRYIKEKGSLRDLNLEIGGKVESVEAIVNPKLSAGNKRKSAEEQRPVSVDSAVFVVDDDPSTSKEEAKMGGQQLTIFYSGRVLVFEDYPMHKARELVSIAKRSGSQMSYGMYSNPPPPPPPPPPPSTTSGASTAARDGLPPRPSKHHQISSNIHKEEIAAEAAAPTPTKDKHICPQPDADNNTSDLPIARRSSLHRFLEKRRKKDRTAAANAIYHVDEQQRQQDPSFTSSSSSKGGIDLNL